MDKEIRDWTFVVNEIVNILRCELDGGFLEDTKKYDDADEDLIYSCLRAIGSQILAIPKLAIVDEDAKVPQRKKYKRTVFDSHKIPPEIYMQGQIDAQEQMLKEGWVKEIR